MLEGPKAIKLKMRLRLAVLEADFWAFSGS
jgi:hypothetical protein